jgi:hypothetical protein
MAQRRGRYHQCFSIVAALLSLRLLVDAQEPSAAAKDEIVKLETQYEMESDPKKKEAARLQLFRREQEVDQDEIAYLHDCWVRERDPEEKQQYADDLMDSAIDRRMVAECLDDNAGEDEALDVLLDVATAGQFKNKEIKLSGKPKATPLKRIFTFDPAPDLEHRWVIRRLSANRIEVWLPRHGWLFDTNGKLLNEAHPPRRDGVGREWYGAFLPDGRWVTTDLWSEDKVLTFFSPRGQWLKEIPADELVPRKPDEYWWNLSTIGWCRSVRSGDAFIVSVGQNGGRGVAWVNWKGEHRILSHPNDPWKLCYPRDLEPKGTYTFRSVPNDRRQITLTRHEDSHGRLVGFPVYETDPDHLKVRIPDGEAFGFWRDSQNVYIVTERTTWIRDALGEGHSGPTTRRSMFYNVDGEFAGWIDAWRIADAGTGDGMLFVDQQQRVISLTKKLTIAGIEQFNWSGGTVAEPARLFPDVRLGFFSRDGKLVLAKW